MFSQYTAEAGLTNEFIKSINQDDKGYIWVGTADGLFKYDGYKFKKIEVSSSNQKEYVRKIFIDFEGVIWVSLDKLGLYKYQNFKWSPVNQQSLNGALIKNITIFDITEDEKGVLWLGTNNGLKFVTKKDGKHFINTEIELFNNSSIHSLVKSVENILVIGLKGRFVQYNTESKKTRTHVFKDSPNQIAQNLYIDNKRNLWISVSQKLLKFNLVEEEFKPVPLLKNATRILSVVQYKDYVYIATISAGVFRLNLKNNEIQNFRVENQSRNALLENNIYTLYISKTGVLWIGTFLKGLNSININTLNFGYINNSDSSMTCAKTSTFISGGIGNSSVLWMENNGHLIKYIDNKECTVVNLNSIQATKDVIVKYVNVVNETVFIYTSQGWYIYNPINNEAKKILNDLKFSNFLTYSKSNKKYYVATASGLFQFKLQDYKTKLDIIEISSKHGTLFNDFAKNKTEKLFFATSKGVKYLNQRGEIEDFETQSEMINKSNITTLEFDNRNNLFLALERSHVFKINKYGKTQAQYKNGSHTNINKILINEESDNLWLGTNKGLGFINVNGKSINFFNKNEGIFSDFLYKSFAFKDAYGKMYFGGNNGITSFYPREIQTKTTSPQVTLTEFFYINKKIEINEVQQSGFYLEKSINDYSELKLQYKDYIFGLEFSVLNILDTKNLKYKYRLEGLQDDWITTDANNRQATYTNLKPGDYTFQVKASNKDGVWSKQPKELKIKVYPAPWLSPWAYAAYVFLLVFSIWWYIRYKTIASRKRAIQLEKTVEERTQEVNRQKQMVESLLEHKNEVFANITHEFKTPISLILGPIDQLAEMAEPRQADKINMIQRNAKRLMLMVGQILKLSQSEQDKEVIRESQAVQPILLMLSESFKSLAQDKNITLSLDNQNDVNVYATSDCLEMVVGNLLSNALKFTNIGGEINIKSNILNNKVCISIEDTGSGIQDKYLDKIFKRFTRLEAHKSIAGTGIGLAVVKEVTEANDGTVTVESQWGKGTIFTLEFPITEIKSVEELSQDMVDQLVDNTANELLETMPNHSQTFIENHVSVLIIEDNLDMQAHIGNVLNSHYNCLFADRGKAGIALALKEVPDIVICDVMMPGMDGYQVTRILRHDGRTSHIPIVLLTALNTKESRIKGWRENIDTYITKPFDATELKVQLQNILNIRKLLQQKTNKAIKSNDSLRTLDLPKQDLKFIEKLKDVIGGLYASEYIQKADIASKMAVSERQLQRKVKALIDENPMDMLRDYRLEKAAMKLKDGYLVGIVSDACGFSSVSYFGSCFKKKYGVTPKQYQGLNKKV